MVPYATGACITRSSLSALLLVVALTTVSRPGAVEAQSFPDLAGRWILNRELSQLNREVGFNADWLPRGSAGSDASSGGGRGGSGGGNLGNFSPRRESEEDSKRTRQLTDEVRTPSAYLTIVDTPALVTITDDHGQSRVFRPDGRDDAVQLAQGVSAGVTTKREMGKLVVLYKAQQGRELRYTYSRVASPPQMVVDVEFVERGGGDKVRRVYTPASETDTRAPTASAPAAATAEPGAAPPGTVPAASPGTAQQPEAFNQQPDAEFKGLKKLGVVVEGLTTQASSCGLDQGAIETAMAKRLADAGFTVVRDSDEDTYLYVNIITSKLSTGLCVSRYDASLYTHTTAKLSYQTTPVLVRVSLLHKGGIAGGGAASHGEDVLRGVQEYVDQFTTRIRGANK